MANLYKTLLFSFLVIFQTINLFGQVDFKLDQKEDGTYVVKLVPNVNWEGKEAITVTAQVTILTPPGLELSRMESVSGQWQNSGIFSKPIENPNASYMVFGLQSLATSQITYKEGEETVLFTFTTKGECNGTLYLMEADDPFLAPNSLNVNVGNQITTFGSGNKNAFGQSLGSVTCQ